jgi:type VI secretion system protein ImpA
MASASIVDFAALLAPIPGDNPAGESLRYAAAYDTLQEARRADDDLDQGAWVRETKGADWSAVIQIATEALAAKTKDLQLAAWLVEALVKRHGFPGLRDGLRLLRELQERFWESLYPEIDGTDLELRAAPLRWLDEKLPLAIKQIPLTQGMNAEAYAWLHWQESREVDNRGRRDQAEKTALMAEGKMSGEQFDKAVETTPLAYYQELFAELNETWRECEQLDQCVGTKFGQEAPGLTMIKAAIADCRTLVLDIGKKKGGLEPPPELKPPPEPKPASPQSVAANGQAPPEPAVVSTSPPGHATMTSLEPQNRADALNRLQALADYFRRTEPHSPVSYLVHRAVRWGEMPLEAWLEKVIHDESVLAQLHETLGLKDSEIDRAT